MYKGTALADEVVALNPHFADAVEELDLQGDDETSTMDGDGDRESLVSESSVLSEKAAASRLAALAVRPALDRFGFVARAEEPVDARSGGFGTDVRAEPQARSAAQARQENTELHKWLSMLGPRWRSWTLAPRRLLLKRRVRRGIPNAVRAHAWDLLTDVPSLHPKLPEYSELVARCTPEVFEEIERDVHRTFPEHALFSQVFDAAGDPVESKRGMPDGARLLARLLAAVAGHDAELSYCQGLNYVGGLLLMFHTEERALCLLLALLGRCGLRECYLPGLPGLRAAIEAFDGLVAGSLPKLHAHLEKEMVEPSLYCTRWFMTLFIGCLPFEASLRALDCICFDRDPKVLFRLGLAVLSLHEAKLLRLRGEALMGALRTAPSECADVDALFSRAFALRVKRRALGGGALGRLASAAVRK
ncbi:rab-GTPase-TBC domain-containing protein [Pavlovales sp. CCMP2436]|nr:rab-GTPase-TBC domain-containing protein [Pavlovales sp. CCMP2436]